MADQVLDISRAFTNNPQQFAKEFENAILALESDYLNRTDTQAMGTKAHVQAMQEIRNLWRNPPENGPASVQIITVLTAAAGCLLPGKDLYGEFQTGTMFFLALTQMRHLSSSEWLAGAIYGIEREVLRRIKEAHILTKPSTAV